MFVFVERLNQFAENLQELLFSFLKHIVFGIDIQRWHPSLTEKVAEAAPIAAARNATTLFHSCDAYYLSLNPYLYCAEQCAHALNMTCAIPTYVMGFTPISLLTNLTDNATQTTTATTMGAAAQSATNKVVNGASFTKNSILPHLTFICFTLCARWLFFNWKTVLKIAVTNYAVLTVPKLPTMAQAHVPQSQTLMEEFSLLLSSPSVLFESGKTCIIYDSWLAFMLEEHNALVADLAEAQHRLTRERALRKLPQRVDENLARVSAFLLAVNGKLSLMELMWEQHRIEQQNKLRHIEAVRRYAEMLKGVRDFTQMVESERRKYLCKLQKKHKQRQNLLESERLRRFAVSSSNSQLLSKVKQLQQPAGILKQSLNSLSQCLKNDPYNRIELPSSETKPTQFIEEVQDMLEFRGASIELFRNHMKELQEQLGTLTSLQKSSSSACNINYIINFAGKMDTRAKDWQEQCHTLLDRAASLKETQSQSDYSPKEQATLTTCLAMSFDCFLNDPKFQDFFALLPALCETLGHSYYKVLQLP